MTDLVTWLAAALNAIESDARAHLELQPDTPDWPTLALAEVAAKRRLLELHHPDGPVENWYWSQRKCAECGRLWHKFIPNRPPWEIGPATGCPTIRLLALPLAGERGYREEWRP